LETKRKWRWGVNRWIVLLFIILSIVGLNLAAPVRPHIQVAPERLTENVTLPVVGDVYLSNTITATVLVDVIIILLAFLVRQGMRRAEKDGKLNPRGMAAVFEMLMEAIYNLTESSAGKWAKKIFPWFATIFLIVLVSNLVKLLPGFETIGLIEHIPAGKEGDAIQPILGGLLNTVVAQPGEYMVVPFFRSPSTDLNFTLALALISVFMTQVIGIQAQGLGYFSKFFNTRNLYTKPFFGAMDFLVGILETISEFAKILSFTFRLFGNMFAGMVLLALVGVMLPVFMPSMILMFEFFIGLIQAFVFGMLTMVFMAQATRGHGGEAHEEAH
jgi:F-type H+-transporting ATPase subunit a